MSEEISPTHQQEVSRNSSSRTTNGHWRQFDNSVNAVSFGFVATAVLISMFLVMALFERFLRPRSSSQHDTRVAERTNDDRDHVLFFDKLEESTIPSYSSGVSVVMPGDNIPTYIAHPAPGPCLSEAICWPIHEQGYLFGSSNFLADDNFPTAHQPPQAESQAICIIADHH